MQSDAVLAFVGSCLCFLLSGIYIRKISDELVGSSGHGEIFVDQIALILLRVRRKSLWYRSRSAHKIL
jgi:hypothetical protein